MAVSSQSPGFEARRIWSDERARSVLFQIVVILGLAAVIAFIVANTLSNLRDRGLDLGFGFIDNPAFFDINQQLISYTSTSTYGRALLVGLLNTLLVSALGIVAATVIGFLAGVLRLSNNWIVGRLVTTWVEFTRNVPVLLQIIFWWAILSGLPRVRDSLSVGDVAFLNNRGVRLPSAIFEPGAGAVLIVLAVSVVAAVLLGRWSTRRQMATGKTFPLLWVAPLVVLAPTVIAYFAAGRPLGWDVPELGRFNFRGGFNVTPELVALWFALSTYTGAFISEIVRAGILSVSKGQSEAAFALGLRPGTTMRKIVIPQALRVIIPPLTSQYLNLTKNSSLAVAIGYQDFVSVGKTVLNQSGQAIEVVALWMIVYLGLSLLTSAFMNWYNRHIALVER